EAHEHHRAVFGVAAVGAGHPREALAEGAQQRRLHHRGRGDPVAGARRVRPDDGGLVRRRVRDGHRVRGRVEQERLRVGRGRAPGKQRRVRRSVRARPDRGV
ncbi:hypothetical protein EG873_15895, partial [Enterococcus faecalis]